MKLGGLQKLTLLDFPGHVACTVFTQGCNFRCPFCHNSSLVLGTQELPKDELIGFLKKRQGLLDGVAITGGEPLLWPDICGLMEEIKALGYQIKLDTNGSFPQRLGRLVEQGLVDYVAMDIKNSKESYSLTAGTKDFLPQVEQSVKLLMESGIDYEFRTTVVSELHKEDDFHQIGTWLKGAKRYFLQCYVDSGDILAPGLHAPTKDEMEQYLAIARSYIPQAELRGI